MAIENYYGRVVLEKGTIGEDEPIVVFRAQDKLVPKVLAYYHLFCLKENCNEAHLNLILDSRKKIQEWQKNNTTKTPDK